MTEDKPPVAASNADASSDIKEYILEMIANLNVPTVLVGLGVIVTVGFAISVILSEFANKKRKALKKAAENSKTLTDPNVKVPLKLTEKHELSHDTRRFRFGLPSAKHVLGGLFMARYHCVMVLLGLIFPAVQKNSEYFSEVQRSE